MNSSNSSEGNRNTSKQISPSKHWFFTWNNYKQSDIQLILDVSSNSSEKCIFQEEIGENGTPHLQGYIMFKKKLRPMSVFMDIYQIHWEKVKNISAAVNYCQKEDTRKEGTSPYTFGNVTIKKELKILKYEQLYDWQLSVVEMCQEEPDDRTINWFWEKEGNRGKTQLVKYIMKNFDAIICSGKSADIKYMCVKYYEKWKIYPTIILYNIPRTVKDYVSYTGIEELKDGVFMSSKYDCECVLMNSPHVFCFANFEPELEAVSKDRWNIINL